MFLASLILSIFFQTFLHREILNFWSIYALGYIHEDVWHVQLKVWFGQNFSTSRYCKNLKKISLMQLIFFIKNIYFA